MIGLKLSKRARIRLIILGALLLILGVLMFFNKFIVVTEYGIPSEKVAGTVTVAQVSDLHNARFGSAQKRLLDKLRDCDPDIIAVTGDLIDSNRTDIDTAMEFIDGAVQIAPVYYVSGNHEAWVAPEVYGELKSRMEAAGVTVLENEVRTVTVGESRVNILGIADPDFSIALAEDDETVIIGEIDGLSWDSDSFTLLLSHRPEVYESYKGRGIDLVLTGHAHGGQFRLPFIGGIVAPDQGFFPKYTAGSFTDGQVTMIISRGLGNSVIPLRVNNCPEIVVAKLGNGT